MMIDAYGTLVEWKLAEENWSTLIKPSLSATLFITNSTWIARD
jgi:hypothetical protein